MSIRSLFFIIHVEYLHSSKTFSWSLSHQDGDIENGREFFSFRDLIEDVESYSNLIKSIYDKCSIGMGGEEMNWDYFLDYINFPGNWEKKGLFHCAYCKEIKSTDVKSSRCCNLDIQCTQCEEEFERGVHPIYKWRKEQEEKRQLEKAEIQRRREIYEKSDVCKKNRESYNKRKLRAPPWANTGEIKRAIKKIYDDCPPGFHVDHIVPLLGVDVSGLHVPWNLQYLPAIENIKKSNKFDGDAIKFTKERPLCLTS